MIKISATLKLSIIGLIIFTMIFLRFQGSLLQRNTYSLTTKLLLNGKTFLLSTGDYNRLLNISFNFSMINQVCQESAPVLVLIVVHSAPSNFKKRQTIRDTWGQVEETKQIVFMIGDPSSPEQQKKLEEENTLFGDIVQGNFIDNYRNLTYKHVMVLKYFVYHCPQAKYLLKTDDDVFINWPSMKNFLTYDLCPSSDEPTIYCVTRTHSKVERNDSKWVVSFGEYPEEVYPQYCLGYVIVYTPEVIFTLYKEAQTSNSFLWVDDAFVTGILFKNLDYTHTDIESLKLPVESLNAIINHLLTLQLNHFYLK
ncbi:lactosylceramide 1,3-N-acetyl-beta-D-glucosaminyltransferase-like [Diabrotica virgifera virgifera]|uniref:Hexosyltransferase n=1 Tax=Diabrotica virgifera virgifera TaxID=50390 RepID=A0ABM5L3T7_DIAVI|nr:lactosylceramide 1,3-N-acetyl-beta-D-glucosaminyltransferase-like [Diabrotica virgifera virgifera]XP_050517112.1 lactosylceramide 1,3-N-acetyl-beta-D-glucosaminyltransferase-like [Diabrotica virgifera virgifera]XP_050517113.1 lactosylceramide 1,3-N-acetyl-beta-D-glucosaminyltransferase-like [Diabrotica virgifera virgifera]XP_050517114.1 lactosylceramide 1,3-N-acetyl-beta-D-glucosaminyltransferase-like [Diabrotica virgifera virgifera]